MKKSWSKHNLPEELWPEILSRLPVKSLLRFRCVSRSWKNWIDDPDFTLLHLNRFNNRLDSPILFKQSKSECVIKNSETLRTISSLGFLQSDPESVHVLRSTPTRNMFSVHWWIMLSSFDGLFLLYDRHVLMLWNPSIRKTLPLPPLPEIPFLHADDENADNVGFGLGFDPIIKDYKVVKFVNLQKENVHFAAVYTLRTNSWKLVECQGEGRKELDFDCWQSSISFNGVIYGLGRYYHSCNMKLVSFDLRSEVFSSLELPVTDGSNFSLTLADDGCSLALVHVLRFNGTMWTLEQVGDDTSSLSWTQRYTFVTAPEDQIYRYEFLCMKKNGEMLLKWHNKVVCYNLETQQRKILMEKNKRSFGVPSTVTYKESLVLHSQAD